MSAPIVAAAGELAEAILTVITEAGLSKVTVTDQPGQVERHAAGGVVVIAPAPALKFPTWNVTEIEWKVVVVTGPAGDELGAWLKADEIIDALVESQKFDIEDAQPSEYKTGRPGLPALPAYVLTIHDTHNH